ncbi:hypothetical protein HLM50_12830 [Sulfitobacter sp. Ks41]|uniref:hypothetical protein n=1 Tax=Sulfitobacter sp. Ks41 TaxID=2731139 RepID=UPI0023E3505F|nr:hypothetical protein [Sulfitobacter sp. Ks41]MDF3361950.1 hypothetical protein [Sulfitobacter sp. Ks41]
MIFFGAHTILRAADCGKLIALNAGLLEALLILAKANDLLIHNLRLMLAGS